MNLRNYRKTETTKDTENTKNLSGLPEGWSWVKLGDVVKNFKRGPFGSAIKKSFFVPSGYKVYEQKNAIYKSIELGDYFIDNKKFQELENFEVGPGDLIVSCSGTIGKIYQLPNNAPKGVINQALLRIRLEVHKITIKYFLELFESRWFQKQILVETRGSAMLNIAGVKELKQIPIPLPPLPEQHRIVEKIEELFSELDNGIENLKKAKAQIKTYRQAVLKFAFEGRLTTKDTQNTQKLSDLSALSGLPKGWNKVKFNNFVKLQRGYDLPLKNIVQGEYPVITSSGIKGFHNEFKAEGPILVTGRSGSVGSTHYFEYKKYWPHNTVLFVKDFCGNYPKFIYYFFLQFNFKSFSASTAVPTLDRKQLYNETINQPPYDQQTQIVEEIERRFSVADKMEAAIDESLKKAEALKQSILKQAFEGKLVQNSAL